MTGERTKQVLTIVDVWRNNTLLKTVADGEAELKEGLGNEKEWDWPDWADFEGSAAADYLFADEFDWEAYIGFHPPEVKFAEHYDGWTRAIHVGRYIILCKYDEPVVTYFVRALNTPVAAEEWFQTLCDVAEFTKLPDEELTP